MADLRPVTEDDLPALCALLRERIETSMFPLANLDAHGLDSPHPRGVSGWCRPDCSGVVFVTTEGVVMPQMPGACDWDAVARCLAGRDLLGVLGDTVQARALQSACGLAGAPVELARDEQGYRLDLADLIVPPTAGLRLQPLDAAWRDLLIDWRAAYSVEILGAPPGQARDRAAREIDGYLAKGTHRMLMQDGAPVAMTGFNAVVGDVVQIGAVFTPVPLRRRGLASAAVGLHLAEARDRGVCKAVLFAASEAAGRVYEGLGFRKHGGFSMILFDGPQRVAA